MNRFGQNAFHVLVMGVAVLLIALPLIAQESEEKPVDPVTTVAPIHWMRDLTVIDGTEAILTRMEHGLSMSFETLALEPRTIATIWWVIFDAPENCSDE